MKAYEMKMVFSISVGFREIDTILRQMGMDETLQIKDAVSVNVEQTISFIPNEEYIQAVSNAIKQCYEKNGIEIIPTTATAEASIKAVPEWKM